MGDEDMTVTIITNNVPRPVLDDYHLTEDERKEFDYIDWDAIDRNEDSAMFVRYKGELIDLNDLEPVHNLHQTFPKWDAYKSDTFFSGILMKWCDQFETVIMGRYYS
jgi:hypothetical protein